MYFAFLDIFSVKSFDLHKGISSESWVIAYDAGYALRVLFEVLAKFRVYIPVAFF